MPYTIFSNDDNVKINVIADHPFTTTFVNRNHHEVIFRQINTYLIKNKLIKNNIIDLGAWIGDNSIPWAKNIDGNVYAIDPSPENCSFIEKTAELNRLNNIKVIQTAISDKNEILTTNENLQHCSFVYGNPGIDGIYKVESVTLDFLYERGEIDNIGYIHLDVEGMENRIILGASTIINKFQPIITFEQHLEIDDYKLLSSYLTDMNYQVFMIDETLPGCRSDCRNFIAFPNFMNIDNFKKEFISVLK
jgi:FkbM family methyltransferase